MITKKPLRVAMVTSDFPPASGGIAQWALGVTNELCRLGHSVTVFAQAASIGSSTVHDGAPFRVVKMIDFEWTRLRSTWAAWYNLRIMAGGRFDVVIATHWALGATAVALGATYPVRTVIVLHGSEVLRRRNWFEARKFVNTLKRASLVMAVSGAVKKRVIETTGVDRITVIHNGIEPTRFRAQAPDAAFSTASLQFALMLCCFAALPPVHCLLPTAP